MEPLTRAQEKLCDTVVAEYDAMLNRHPKPNLKVIKAWLDVVYQTGFELPTPTRVEIVASPVAAFKLATALTGVAQTTLDWCGVSDAGWVACYDAFYRMGEVTKDEMVDVLKLKAFQRCAWATLLLDECAIVVQYPTTLRRDEEGNLHSAKGPCIQWADGVKDWAWHGVWVPERIITEPRSYSKAEYEAITNTEVRRALSEAAGHKFIVNLLDAQQANEWVDPTSCLRYTLYTTSTQRWLRKQSPALQNGKQPYYFEPVHEDLKTAQAARKWQAVPTLTPGQCEADPALDYRIET